MSKKKAGQVSKGLIPGLPPELAVECLVRAPFQFQPAMKSVCSSWRSLLSDDSSNFTRERRRCGKAELLLCLVQPLNNLESKAVEETSSAEEVLVLQQQPRVSGTPRFGLSVYNATMSTWNRVAFPEHHQRFPLFCECVAVQDAGKILLVGGWDPETLRPVRDVYVLELAGGGSGRRWRRGAPMNEARSFFACASAVGSTKVYVAGGHDEHKNALRSAEVYDVEKDEWSSLPPMSEGRDECQGVEMGPKKAHLDGPCSAHSGFCVLSGYGTESQGRFRTDAEVYDPVTNSWSRIENVWPYVDTSPRGRIAGDASKLWCFTNSELEESKRRWESEDDSRKWKLDLESIQLPVTGSSVYGGSFGGEAVVMIGGGSECEGRGGVMMRKMSEKWSRVHDIPFGFSTLPFSHASIYV